MKLRTYIIRRLIMIIPLFFVMSILVFLLIHLAPGDPILTMFGTTTPYNKEIVEIMRKKYGLDRPLYEQYLIWLNMLLHGDLGYSYLNRRPISMMISERVIPTLEITGLALIITVIFSTLLGVIAAVKRNSIIDHLVTSFAVTGRGLPGFLIALILIFIFSLNLGWLPVCGRETPGMTFSSAFEYWLDRIKHLILPVVSLSWYQIAYLVRLVRASMLDVLNQEYILTARAKGLKESIVIYKHALKNALLPEVTIIGLYVGYLIAGAAVIETIFAWPGLGSLLVTSVHRREYLLIMDINLLIFISVLVANLLTDIIYAYLDPRIRY